MIISPFRVLEPDNSESQTDCKKTLADRADQSGFHLSVKRKSHFWGVCISMLSDCFKNSRQFFKQAEEKPVTHGFFALFKGNVHLLQLLTVFSFGFCDWPL